MRGCLTPLFPNASGVREAAERIRAHVHHTPVLRSRSLDALAGAELHFKCENLQRAGAFKFRGACNAVWSLRDADAARGVVTHSSGNHGAALALAARTRGIAAHVVVPEGAIQSKVAAIEAYGAKIYRCAPTMAAREALAQEVRARTGAVFVHPFTDPYVIMGQGTAALELINEVGKLDALVAPIGGGGLIGGSAGIASHLDPALVVYAAEPQGAADALLSMRRGERVTDVVPDTVCDGLRAGIGEVNFQLLCAYRVNVLGVEDKDTIAATRLLWSRLKLVVELSSAIAFAAVLRHREAFAGRRVGLILTGGNVDLDALPWAAHV